MIEIRERKIIESNLAYCVMIKGHLMILMTLMHQNLEIQNSLWINDSENV